MNTASIVTKSLLLALGGIAVAAPPSHAGDGRIEISQACVAQGCVPGTDGPIGPSFSHPARTTC